MAILQGWVQILRYDDAVVNFIQNLTTPSSNFDDSAATGLPSSIDAVRALAPHDPPAKKVLNPWRSN